MWMNYVFVDCVFACMRVCDGANMRVLGECRVELSKAVSGCVIDRSIEPQGRHEPEEDGMKRT